jgi:acyl carrier protein
MNKKTFYQDLLEELEFEDISQIDDSTIFKQLEEWDSMSVLVVINFFKQKIGIDLTAETLNNTDTFGELLNNGS